MLQKIIKVGNSLGITLPREFVKQSNLMAGQKVTTSTDATTGILQLQTKDKSSDKLLRASLSPEFIKRVDSFIKQHKPALEKLSKI